MEICVRRRQKRLSTAYMNSLIRSMRSVSWTFLFAGVVWAAVVTGPVFSLFVSALELHVTLPKEVCLHGNTEGKSDISPTITLVEMEVAGASVGVVVPLWKHVNIVKDRVLSLKEPGFAELKAAWSFRTVLT